MWVKRKRPERRQRGRPPRPASWPRLLRQPLAEPTCLQVAGWSHLSPWGEGTIAIKGSASRAPRGEWTEGRLNEEATRALQGIRAATLLLPESGDAFGRCARGHAATVPGAGPVAQEPCLQTSRPTTLAGGSRARWGSSGLAAEGAAPPQMAPMIPRCCPPTPLHDGPHGRTCAAAHRKPRGSPAPETRGLRNPGHRVAVRRVNGRPVPNEAPEPSLCVVKYQGTNNKEAEL